MKSPQYTQAMCVHDQRPPKTRKDGCLHNLSIIFQKTLGYLVGNKLTNEKNKKQLLDYHMHFKMESKISH